MNRRQLIALLGGAFLVSSPQARGQQPGRTYRIGGLYSSPREAPQHMALFGELRRLGFIEGQNLIIDPLLAALEQGLSETGYVEGKNLAMEYRSAEGHYDRLPALAAVLVRRKVDVIVTPGTVPTSAAKGATSTIPIVFTGVGDPIGAGLVASLARPGGNLTGFSNSAAELNPKRLELLSELVPQAKVIALLVNPNNQPNTERIIEDVEGAARTKGVQLTIVKASSESEIDAAFATLVELHAGALFASGDPFFFSRREQLLALASRDAVPTIYIWREFPAAGGLISYGVKVTATFRQAGSYAGKILNGARPADLPVQQPTTFELVVNLKTAQALGRADEVIE